MKHSKSYTWHMLGVWFFSIAVITLTFLARFTPLNDVSDYNVPSQHLMGIAFDLNGKNVSASSDYRPLFSRIQMGFYGIRYSWNYYVGEFNFGFAIRDIFRLYRSRSHGTDIMSQWTSDEAIRNLNIGQGVVDFGGVTRGCSIAVQVMWAISLAVFVPVPFVVIWYRPRWLLRYCAPVGAAASLVASVILVAMLTSLRNKVNGDSDSSGITSKLLAPLPLVTCFAAFAAMAACVELSMLLKAGEVDKAREEVRKREMRRSEEEQRAREVRARVQAELEVEQRMQEQLPEYSEQANVARTQRERSANVVSRTEGAASEERCVSAA